MPATRCFSIPFKDGFKMTQFVYSEECMRRMGIFVPANALEVVHPCECGHRDCAAPLWRFVPTGLGEGVLVRV